MTNLSLKAANQIAAAAIAQARELDTKPMAVAVLDSAGTLRALQSEDDVALMRPDIAQGKAWGCIGLGVSTRSLHGAFEARPNMNPAFYAFMGLAGHRLVPSPGGVFIKDGDKVIGAVGVSGDTPDLDEACAVAGIEAAGLTVQI